MTDPVVPLILDLVEWIAKEPRPYAETMGAWRTSCPRLTIWEDAVDLGYIERQPSPKEQTLIVATKAGERFLRAHGRVCG
jgi:hypothetical protein